MSISLHHVQIAMPMGGEDRARAFYGAMIGLTETPKPEDMRKRGGCWFEGGTARIHLGIEEDFRPARKAHPALQISDFIALKQKLLDAGYEISPDNPIDGLSRFFVDDPFGNKVEIIASEHLT